MHDLTFYEMLHDKELLENFKFVIPSMYWYIYVFQIVYIKSEVVGNIRILYYENLFVFCNGNRADEQNTCSQLS